MGAGIRHERGARVPLLQPVSGHHGEATRTQVGGQAREEHENPLTPRSWCVLSRLANRVHMPGGDQGM